MKWARLQVLTYFIAPVSPFVACFTRGCDASWGGHLKAGGKLYRGNLEGQKRSILTHSLTTCSRGLALLMCQTVLGTAA